MLSISLFAEEVTRPRTFYKHSVPTARFCPDSLERYVWGKAVGMGANNFVSGFNLMSAFRASIVLWRLFTATRWSGLWH